jgi:hypothetical protein
MIRKIEPMGFLVRDCPLEGETKAEEVWPAHPNGVQVSSDRWLIVYATRGYRFMDDDRSIVYQLRQGAPDGRVIREGTLSKSFDGWDPMGDGRKYFKQHGHPVVFGVPKGAVINARRLAHENVFVAKWRTVGIFDRGEMDDSQLPEEDKRKYTGMNWVSHKINVRYGWGTSAGQGVEWVQFRLNGGADNIEIIQPVRRLRQKGHESGAAFCSPADGQTVSSMNQSFIQAVPFNDDASQWADVNHFDGSRIAPLKYAFNADLGLYEWVETGPMAGTAQRGLYESSLVRAGDSWVIAARPRINGRRGPGAGWMRTDDLFGKIPEPVYTDTPDADTPIAVFMSADGIMRLFANDVRHNRPDRGGRNPLWCWEVDPDGFSITNRRVVFDTFDAGVPIRPECDPGADMCKLLPHAGGREQYIVHRVRTRALTIPYLEAVVTPAELEAVGVYYEKAVYGEEYAGLWSFQ